MKRILSRPAAALALALAACAGEDEPAPEPSGLDAADAAALTAALAAAVPGDTVRLTGAAYEGSFDVPAGVAVEGVSAPVVTAAGGAAFVLEGGAAGPTALRGVEIRSGEVGVVATGGGTIELADVTLVPATGVGLAADGVGALALRRVEVQGPVTDANLGDLGGSIDARATAVIGVAVAGSQVELEEVEIAGIAGFGALFHGSDGRWDGGRVAGCVGSSVLVEGGTIELEGVAIEDARVGTRVGSNLLANGLVVGAAATVRTVGVRIERIPGVGLLQGAGESHHLDLAVRGGDRAGIWVQGAPGTPDAPAIELSGASVLEGNRGVALLLRESGGAVLDGTRIAGTTLRPTTGPGGGPVDVGDGVQVVGGSGALHLSSVALADNARVGLLLDGGGAAGLSPVLAAVTVDGPADAYGVVTQNGAAERQSLAGISVGEDIQTNDDAAVAQGLVLDVTSALSGVPAAGLIDERGLVGQTGLIDERGRLGGLGGVGEAGLIDER